MSYLTFEADVDIDLDDIFAKISDQDLLTEVAERNINIKGEDNSGIDAIVDSLCVGRSIIIADKLKQAITKILS